MSKRTSVGFMILPTKCDSNSRILRVINYCKNVLNYRIILLPWKGCKDIDEITKLFKPDIIVDVDQEIKLSDLPDTEEFKTFEYYSDIIVTDVMYPLSKKVMYISDFIDEFIDRDKLSESIYLINEHGRIVLEWYKKPINLL